MTDQMPAQFAQGDVIWVPFPFADQPRLRKRPAVVLATPNTQGAAHLIWVMMITSAANRGWPDDISLEEDFKACGLHVPCCIRPAKIATIDVNMAELCGKLPVEILTRVRVVLTDILALK
jgi:mRNA interferase MazF